MCSSNYLLLLFFYVSFIVFENLVFATATDSNLFLDDFDPLNVDASSSSSLLALSSLPDINNENIFGDGTFDDITFLQDDNPLLLAYCADSNQLQLQGKIKARKRDTSNSLVCPARGGASPPLPQLTVPQMPDVLNSIIGGSGDKTYVNQGDVVGRLSSLSSAEIYCGLWTSQPQSMVVPVCGSGNLLDSVRVAQAYYSVVGNSRLSKFSYFFFPYNLCFLPLFIPLPWDDICSWYLLHIGMSFFTHPPARKLILRFEIKLIKTFLKSHQPPSPSASPTESSAARNGY